MATHTPQPPSPRGKQRSSGRRPGDKWSLTSSWIMGCYFMQESRNRCVIRGALYASNMCVHLQVDNSQCRERLREGLCGVCRQWVHWGSTQTYPLPQSNKVTTATCELENLCWIYCGKMRCTLIAALAVIHLRVVWTGSLISLKHCCRLPPQGCVCQSVWAPL